MLAAISFETEFINHESTMLLHRHHAKPRGSDSGISDGLGRKPLMKPILFFAVKANCHRSLP
jgi:hypothetical protein